MHVIVVGAVTVNDPQGVKPNFAAVAPVKLLPVMVTAEPPAMEPCDGVMEATTGTAANVYPGCGVDGRAARGRARATETWPTAWAGVFTATTEADFETMVAAVAPKLDQ